MGVKHSTFLMANCKNFPVNDFPDDILQTIFVNLDGNYLIHICRRVCKRWKAIADLQTLWKEKCSRNGIYKPNINIDVDYKILFFYNPYGKNFIRNWNASEKYKHWEIITNGGHQFKIEEKQSGAASVDTIGIKDLRHCWVTSFGWCMKEQTVDLIKEYCDESVLDNIKPNIVVSEWTTNRKDCASTFVLTVQLLDKDLKELDCCKKENHEAQWAGGEWIEMKHVFKDYPAGVRYIKYTHGGKDNQFWAGHYGSKFTGASVRFQFEKDDVQDITSSS